MSDNLAHVMTVRVENCEIIKATATEIYVLTHNNVLRLKTITTKQL